MQLPFDGHFRRRIYLVRHGQSAPSRPEHGAYGDAISLTETGRREAAAMRDALADVPFDAAWCSDINRTQETAAVILEAHRGLSAQAQARFTEMRGDLDSALSADLPRDEKLGSFAYLLWTENPDARFFGGDHLGDYLARAGHALRDLVRESTGGNILLVSHSGFQRAALCWTLDAVPLGLAKFEQDSCCLNILDIDVDDTGNIVRKHVRLANYTPLDPVKSENRFTDGEKMAMRLSEVLAANNM